MAFKKLLFLIMCLMASSLDGQTLSGPKHGKLVVCYVASWAGYRPDQGRYTLDDLEPDLCTHIVYSFVGLNEKTYNIEPTDRWHALEDNGGWGGFKRLATFKEEYPHLKLLMAVGGWNEGSTKFTKMAEDPATRASFAKSVVDFLTEHQFDGLDLHWKYPTFRDGKPEDKANFVLLAKDLKEAFQPKGYILTAAVGVQKDTMDPAYDFLQLNNYVDYFHMLCYDYHGVWDGVVGANAPLKSSKRRDIATVDYTIKYMRSHGVTPSKMVLGIPLNGRTFVLKDPDTEDIEFGYTPVEAVAFMGPFTKETAYMGYNEICLEKKNKTWTQYWHEKTLTPYLRSGGKVISYDSPRSVSIKVKTALDYELGGFVVWSIDTDDFRGKCDKETDSFVDFIERYQMIVDDPGTGQAFKNFNMAEKNKGHYQYYVINNGKVEVRLPGEKAKNYPILRTINDATTLALEEKRVTEKFFKEFAMFAKK